MMDKKRKIVIFSGFFALLLILFFTNKCISSSTEKEEERTDSVPRPTLIMQLQRCSRLNTAEIKLHKIITHDDEMKLSGKLMGKELSVNIPAGKRKVAIPLYATVKASIDLGKMTDDDIVREGNKITIYLPQPDVEITETHIDHEGVRQFVAITRSNFSDEELQKYEFEGRKSIEASLGSLGIENMARESAARQLIPIVQAFGFKDTDITITFRKDEKNNTILRRIE
jgi:hypothetical protein